MTFSRALLCLFVISISIAAVAADKPANAAREPTETQNPIFGFQSTTSPDSTVLVNPFIQDKADSDLLGQGARSDSYSLSELNGDVCYTMRSYKVRRTERLRENQSGLRDYSTCQMASNYRVRSADAKAAAAKAEKSGGRH